MPFVKDVKDILGMSTEEFQEKMKKLEKLDEIEKKFGDINNLVQTQATGIDEIKGSIAKLTEVRSPYNDGGGDNPPPDDPNKKKVELTDWGVDAEKAFSERTAPIVLGVLDTQASLARRSVQEEMTQKYKDWHLFAEEIDEMAKKNPVQAKANPEFWRNVYLIVKGRHAEEIATDRQNKSGKFFIEPASSSITLQDDANKKPEDKLTQKEIEYATKMGVPLAQYAKYKDEQRVM